VTYNDAANLVATPDNDLSPIDNDY